MYWICTFEFELDFCLFGLIFSFYSRPLDQKNKGFQMMEKMGWKSGQALGENADGDNSDRNILPIDLDIRENRRGLGFGSLYH